MTDEENQEASFTDQILDFVGGISTFSRRFHNAGNGLIGNEDHPRILNGKNLILSDFENIYLNFEFIL